MLYRQGNYSKLFPQYMMSLEIRGRSRKDKKNSFARNVADQL